MQEALPYEIHFPTTLTDPKPTRPAGDEVRRMVEESAVIVLSRKGCCMGYVVRRLLQGLGANPAVYEVDESFEEDVVGALRAADGAVELPVVFMGGRWFGGLDRIMASHITGELTPSLKKAGALWLTAMMNPQHHHPLKAVITTHVRYQRDDQLGHFLAWIYLVPVFISFGGFVCHFLFYRELQGMFFAVGLLISQFVSKLINC